MVFLLLLLLFSILLLLIANKVFQNNVVDRVGCAPFECVDPRCENLTKCLIKESIH